MKESVGTLSQKVREIASGTFNAFENFDTENLKKYKKEILIAAVVAPALLYAFWPEKKPEAEQPETPKSEKPTSAVRGAEAPAINQADVATRQIENTPIPTGTELMPFFMAAIAKTESGERKDAEQLVQFDAISGSKSIRAMINQADPPIEMPSEYLEAAHQAGRLFREGVPDNVSDFKKFLKQKGIEDHRVLSYCAIGKYQIIPQFHFDKMGWDPNNIDDLFRFIKQGEKQEELMTRMTQVYGQEYNWDFALMMACHYGGPKAANKLREDAGADWLHQEQANSYPSVVAYVRKTLGYMRQEIDKRETRAAA